MNENIMKTHELIFFGGEGHHQAIDEILYDWYVLEILSKNFERVIENEKSSSKMCALLAQGKSKAVSIEYENSWKWIRTFFRRSSLGMKAGAMAMTRKRSSNQVNGSI